MANSHILTRPNSIEAELAAVRRRLQDREQPRSARGSLFGILEGEEFTEEEIDAIIAGTFRGRRWQGLSSLCSTRTRTAQLSDGKLISHDPEIARVIDVIW